MLGSALGSAADWATVMLGIVAVLGFLGVVAGFAFKIWQLLQVLDEKSDRVETQVTPNGGTTESSADRILRIEEHLKTHIESDEKVQREILSKLPAARRRTTKP